MNLWGRSYFASHLRVLERTKSEQEGQGTGMGEVNLRKAFAGSGGCGVSAFQAAPRKTIIANNSIHIIKPIAAASPP